MVAVLNLLSDRPEGITLTEIGGQVGESPSTMVHVLAALIRAGYLIREPVDRRYHLGPALVEPGRVAAARYPGLAVARRAMTDLTARFGAPCFAFVRQGRWVRLAHQTSGPQSTPALWIGELVPVVPPLAVVFMAWAPSSEVAAWVAADPAPSPGRADWLHTLLRHARDRGYVVEGPPDAGASSGADLVHTLQAPPSPGRDRELRRMMVHGEDHVVDTIDPGAAYRTTGVGAPVFDEDGRVALSITVATIDLVLTGDELTTVGEAVRAAADAVTASIDGVPPTDGSAFSP